MKLSQKKRQIPYAITYWNLKYGTGEPIYETETLIDMENGLVVAKGEGEGVGWTGSLGLVDVNYSIENGEAMRSCLYSTGN